MSQPNSESTPSIHDQSLDALALKISRSKKYKPGSFRKRYLVFLYCVLMYLPTATAGFISLGMSFGYKDYDPNPTLAFLGSALLFIAVAGLLAASLVYSSIIYRAWKQVEPFGGVPAWVAVALIYIPVINIFWIWVASYGLSRLQLRMHQTCRIETRAARPWIPLVWCLLVNGAFLPVAVVLIDPGLNTPSRYVFNTIIILSILWWPYVLHDTKEAAESIATWRTKLDDAID